MASRGAPIAAEHFAGINRRGGDFGLEPWQITAATDLIPIDDGAGLSLRPPYNAGGTITGTTITDAGHLIGPFAVGSKLVAIYDAAFSAPSLPAGVTEVWAMRAPGYVPQADPALGWTYVGHVLLDATLVVLLRWTDGSLHLHVWDGKAGYASEVNGTGCPWLELTAAERIYTPRLGVAGGRVWISSPKGDLWFCAIGRPRIWWIKSADDLAVSGYEWCRTIAAGATTAVLFVPYPKAEIQNPDRWCGMVVEQLKMVAGAATWVETSYVLTLDSNDPLGTAEPSAIPAWTKVTVPNTEWVSGAELTFRIRLVPPTAELGGRRRVNRPLDLASFKTPRTESWQTAGQTRLEVRDPSAYPYHGNGAAAPVLSPAPSGSAAYEFTEVQIGGRAVTCIKAITLTVAYASGTVVTWSYGMGDGFAVLVPTFQASVAGKTIDIPGTYGANGAYVSGDATGVYVNAKTKALLFLTNFAKPDDIFVGKVVYVSTHPAVTPVPTITDPGATADAAWDEARFQESLLNAGDARAGVLPTAQHAGGQSGVTLMASARNRLLVCYADTIQLWEVSGAPATMARLDRASWGTGTAHPAIRGVSTGDFAVIPSSRGLAAVSLSGQLNDRMSASDMAGAIFGSDPGLIGTPVVHDVAAWPQLAAVVAALTVPGDTTPSLWAFLRDGEGKALGWWRWDLPSGTVIRPGTLEAAGERLHWHGSGTLRWAQARDPERFGVGYQGRLSFAYQHGGRPGVWKRWVGMDLVCHGLVGVAMRMLTTKESVPLGSVTGNSYQRNPVPLMATEPGLAFDLTLEAVDGAARIDRLEARAMPLGR